MKNCFYFEIHECIFHIILERFTVGFIKVKNPCRVYTAQVSSRSFRQKRNTIFFSQHLGHVRGIMSWCFYRGRAFTFQTRFIDKRLNHGSPAVRLRRRTVYLLPPERFSQLIASCSRSFSSLLVFPKIQFRSSKRLHHHDLHHGSPARTRVDRNTDYSNIHTYLCSPALD